MKSLRQYALALIEILRSLGCGLVRLVESSTREDCPALVEFSDIRSAVAQLGRGVSSSLSGESYLDRLDSADPDMLEQALAHCGYTRADIETWRKRYDRPVVSVPS